MAYPRKDKTITEWPARNEEGWVMTLRTPQRIPEREKLMFLLIHKNGSCSLKNVLKGTEKYYSVQKFNDLEYTKFVILRDPWDRFIDGVKQVYKRNLKRIEVEEMFAYLESHSEEETNVHLVLQSWFLKDRKFDYYLKLENIQEDWKILESKFGVGSFPHIHKSDPKEMDSTKEVFKKNKDLKEKALEYLAEDYELINRVFP